MIQQPQPWHICGKDEKSNLKRYTHPNFIAALCTIAKTKKQPKCATRDEWIRKV